MQTKLYLKHFGDDIDDDDYVGLYECSCKTKAGAKFATRFYLPEMLTPPRDLNIQVLNVLARVLALAECYELWIIIPYCA